MKLPASLLAASAAFLALPAQAQNTDIEPTYETVTLAAGFPNDPYVVELQAGGDLDAGLVAEGCLGGIANAPDVRLHYTAGDMPLFFRAASHWGDTTLVINLPDGSWICNDDYGESLDSQVALADPPSGQYDIWVGEIEGGFADATLSISELSGE